MRGMDLKDKFSVLMITKRGNSKSLLNPISLLLWVGLNQLLPLQLSTKRRDKNGR